MIKNKKKCGDQKGHNLKKKIKTMSNSNEEKNKDVKVAITEKPSCWKVPLKCKINMTEFLERAKSYAHLVSEDKLLAILLNFGRLEKNYVSLCGGHVFTQNLLLHKRHHN